MPTRSRAGRRGPPGSSPFRCSHSVEGSPAEAPAAFASAAFGRASLEWARPWRPRGLPLGGLPHGASVRRGEWRQWQLCAAPQAGAALARGTPAFQGRTAWLARPAAVPGRAPGLRLGAIGEGGAWASLQSGPSRRGACLRPRALLRRRS